LSELNSVHLISIPRLKPQSIKNNGVYNELGKQPQQRPSPHASFSSMMGQSSHQLTPNEYITKNQTQAREAHSRIHPMAFIQSMLSRLILRQNNPNVPM